MIRCDSRRRGGFVVLTAVAGLLVLIVVAALFLQYGIHGLRQEHTQRLSAQCDQIALSLRDLSRRVDGWTIGEMREIAIGDLLPPGGQGTAWLGGEARPGGGRTVNCRIQIELGRDRLDRVIEWPAD
jgi:hypothetical protein